MDNRTIRPIVLGLVRKGREILVGEGYDYVNDEIFYRALGGGIEYGEESSIALKREFKEELNTEITIKHYVGMIENLFIFEGDQGHEIVIVYEIELPSELYQQEELTVIEGNQKGKATWIDIDQFLAHDKILYPAGIKKYL